MSRLSRSLTLAFLLIPLAVPGFAQTGLFSGTIVDHDGNPLSGARVTITSEELTSYRKTLTSDKKGQFKLRFQGPQFQYRFEFLVEKSGYQSITQPVTPSSTQRMKERFELGPAESAAVESHGDLSSVVSGASNEAIAAFNEGLTAQKDGDLAAARAHYETALAVDPALAPAHVALAQVLLDSEQYAAAIDSAERALSVGARRSEALLVKHQALRALGRDAEAEAIAGELELVDANVAAAHTAYNAGGEAFQAGDKPAALINFRRAAELDPTLIDAHHAIATMELANGNHEVSAEAASRALALGSEDIRTLRVLYDAYDALGRTDDLIEIAPRLAAIDPDFGGAKLVEQAAALWNAGQAERAVSLSRAALAVDPNIGRAYYFIGLDHLSKGESSQAKAALSKFIDMAPDDAEAATAREMLTYIE